MARRTLEHRGVGKLHSYATQLLTREERAAAKAATANQFTDKQRAYIDFVLAQYVLQGVAELDGEKLSPLLKLKYHNALADAFVELGTPEQVRGVFIGFQGHLCSGLMIPDTHLGENSRHREVSDEQATSYVYNRVQTRGSRLGIGPGL